MEQWIKHLLCSGEDLSLNLQNTQSQTQWMSVILASTEVEAGKSWYLKFQDSKSSAYLRVEGEQLIFSSFLPFLHSFFLFLFFKSGFLSGCPGTRFVDQAGLKLTDICLLLPP